MNNKKITSLLLVTAFLMSGCSKTAENTVETALASQSETVAETTVETTEETTEETVPVLFEYDPHPYSYLIAEDVPKEHWDALYNLIDALRVGADTFECSSKEAYEWAMRDTVLANLCPAACLKVTSESNDGSKPYENGTGRIYYKIPVEEFLTREAEFEKMVTDILNRTVEKDDDEFEKCLKLYLYMAKEYEYDHDDSEKPLNVEGYLYTTMMNHKGICVDLSGVYAFLLLEAGVEAISIGSYDNLDHAWTYAVVNGKGYHIDSTWALMSERETDNVCIDYFMMSDDKRIESGCGLDDITVQLLPDFWISRSKLRISATDDSYYSCMDAQFERLDEENKILYYTDGYGKLHEIKYGSAYG